MINSKVITDLYGTPIGSYRKVQETEQVSIHILQLLIYSCTVESSQHALKQSKARFGTAGGGPMAFRLPFAHAGTPEDPEAELQPSEI